MRSYTASFAALSLLASVAACGQGQLEGPAPAPTFAPDIPGVVEGGTPVEFIADGFEGTEGPIALPNGDLIFTETNAGRITRIDQDDNISTWLEDTNMSNALGFGPDGRLISVQTTEGQTQVGVIYPRGSEEVLTDNYRGQTFGRPNDIVVSKTGDVYFTEPGRGEGHADPAIYYIPRGGDIRVAYHADDIGFPNGILLSPDEDVLYVNDAQGQYLVAFDVESDGSLTNRRNLVRYEDLAPPENGRYSSRADGLAIDSQGRLYAAVPPGVQIFSPQGQHLGTIPVPLRVQNLAFAGPDKRTLYMVGSGAAFKVRMQAQGYQGRAK